MLWFLNIILSKFEPIKINMDYFMIIYTHLSYIQIGKFQSAYLQPPLSSWYPQARAPNSPIYTYVLWTVSSWPFPPVHITHHFNVVPQPFHNDNGLWIIRWQSLTSPPHCPLYMYTRYMNSLSLHYISGIHFYLLLPS